MKEIAIQRSIIDLTKQAGGNGLKMSSQYLSGMLDLLIRWPGFPPVLAEVKKFGEVYEGQEFKRQIETTALQDAMLKDWSPFSCVLMCVDFMGKSYVTICRPTETHFSNESFCAQRSTERRKGAFNLSPLFDWAGIPRIGQGVK